ncbi:MAG: hypothetical protein IKD77_03855 [Bacilli bacterium]|nr:hypothetical protein [Bacilli bacterium]
MNNNVLAVGDSKMKEHICSTCVYSKCTLCPNKAGWVRGSEQDPKDFPQIIEYESVRITGFLKVFSCRNYVKKSSYAKKADAQGLVRETIDETEFDWSTPEHRFVLRRTGRNRQKPKRQ